MADRSKSAKKNGRATEVNYDKLNSEELRDQASQSLADFAMGKIDTDEMNARARKSTERARAIRRAGTNPRKSREGGKQ